MYQFNLIDVVGLTINAPIVFLLLQYLLKERKDAKFKKYFTNAIIVKFIALFCHYFYHYFLFKGGDTFAYYDAIVEVTQAFFLDPTSVFVSLFVSPDNYSPSISTLIHHYFYYGDEEALTIKIGFIFSWLSFGSYFSIGLWYSAFALWGLWKLFITFNQLYPTYHKYNALICLFFPSTVFWSSAISKDALTMGGVGLFTWTFYEIFIRRSPTLSKIITFLLAFHIVSVIKGYIIVAFLPGCLVWGVMSYQNTVKNKSLQQLLKIVLILFVPLIVGGAFFLLKNSPLFLEYTSPEVLEKANVYYKYLSDASLAASAYSIGDFDPSIVGLLKIIPAAINVTLFRPYPFEIKNAAMVIASLESTATLLITIYLVFKIGLFNTFSFIRKDVFLLFAFLFVMIFSIAVGITSGNFGSLMRYKIPMLPFYFLLLTVLFFKTKENRKPRKI
jgi:hypothetical protein